MLKHKKKFRRIILLAVTYLRFVEVMSLEKTTKFPTSWNNLTPVSKIVNVQKLLGMSPENMAGNKLYSVLFAPALFNFISRK